MTRNASHATPTANTAVPAVGSRLDTESGIGYLVVLATRELTGGRMTELEAVCGPGAPGVEERSFANHEVRFEVIEGRLTVGMAGEPREVRAGAALTVPAGTPHRIWVEADRGPARFIWRMKPATEETDLTGLVFGEPASERLA
jgi:mannose-6-phosphate isomerase-like protein (cupin superfamily)